MPGSYQAQGQSRGTATQPNTTKKSDLCSPSIVFPATAPTSPRRSSICKFARGKQTDDWKEIWERLHTRQMPPSSHAQPTAAERERLPAWIEEAFAGHTLKGQPDPGPLRPRRLNVREYMNTLRDLAVAKDKPAPRASFLRRQAGRQHQTSTRRSIPPVRTSLRVRAAHFCRRTRATAASIPSAKTCRFRPS